MKKKRRGVWWNSVRGKKIKIKKERECKERIPLQIWLVSCKLSYVVEELGTRMLFKLMLSLLSSSYLQWHLYA